MSDPGPTFRLSRLIAEEEGFFRPGSKPNRFNNPGDLRHSPHSTHLASAPDDIGQIADVADGWADLERQLMLFAKRGLTVREAIETYAPPNENNSAQYLDFVCKGLGCSPDTPMALAVLVK